MNELLFPLYLFIYATRCQSIQHRTLEPTTKFSTNDNNNNKRMTDNLMNRRRYYEVTYAIQSTG